MSDENTEEVEVEETPLQKAVRVVELSRRNDLDEEGTLMALVSAGFGFRKAGKMYDAAMESLGLRMSSKARYEAVSALLDGQDVELDDWDDVVSYVDFITENVEATSDSQARAALKKFCGEHEIEFPTKPKTAGKPRADSLTTKMHEFIVDNPHATDEDIVAYCQECGQEKSQAHAFFVRIAGLCKRYHEARVAE